MPIVHHVKKARKDNPVAKAGEPYYWWKNNWGPKRYSKTQPKPSQLTGSPFISEWLSIGEDLEEAVNNAATGDDLQTAIDEAKDRIEALRDETEGNLENMPEGLQQGPTGELLQERIDGCEQWADALDAVDTDIPDADHIDEEDGDITDPQELILDRAQEIMDADPGVAG
jgi:hypothetical protein